ncbi:MAG: redoxin domain-containing protein [Myxococcales bacterium]|nr:redoxin domain-containing protein [Myxococcales bacterium]MCB9748384.1 redoxin domain-containing protein [Myxococcales bacterium]
MPRIRAPELAPAVTWLNCVRPLELRSLRGQVVVLDFWTHGCINCIHTLPVLRALEQRFARAPLVIIGVHSAKFTGETPVERIKDAIARLQIDHPVVVDDHQQIWSRYAIRSWPTLVVVRPDGTIASTSPGEPQLDVLSMELTRVFRQARADGTLAERPFDFHATLKPSTGALCFPGKAALSGDGQLAIADSGHNRILICAADGTVQACIGSGERGRADGSFEDASFDNPQGLAWDRGTLWICDTQNHRICQADLEREEVTTIAGTGALGRAPLTGVSPALATELRSPWDLTVIDTRLYVALAGSHQVAIVELHPDGGITGPPVIQSFAGTGSEALHDDRAENATFAQPSSIERDGSTLVVVDAESSSVRCIDLDTGATSTLVGQGLFEYGDADGALGAARFQHPLGLARTPDGAFLIADTYNDSVRHVDPLQGVVRTLYRGEGERALREPGDVVITPGGDVLVVDTGNHRIARIGRDGSWKGELAIEDTTPRRARTSSGGRLLKPPPPVRDVIPLLCEPVGSGRGELRLHVLAPTGWRFQQGAAVQLRFEVTRLPARVEIAEQRSKTPDDDAMLSVPITVITRPPEDEGDDDTRAEVRIDVEGVLCSIENENACVPAHSRYRLELSLAGTAPCDLDVKLSLTPSK